jgi:hypothetical protein
MNYSSETDIYQHGIAIEGNEKPPALGLIATTRLPIYSGFDLTIVDLRGNSLNERAVHVANVNKAHSVADYYEESDLRYCVLATLYHLNRLTNLYVESTRLFEQLHPKGTANRATLGSQVSFMKWTLFLAPVVGCTSQSAKFYGSTTKLDRAGGGVPFARFLRHPATCRPCS